MPAAVCRVGASGHTGGVEAELGEATANAWANKEGEANDGTEEGEVLGALLLRGHVTDEGHGNGHAGPDNAGAEAGNEEQGVRVAEALYSAACEIVVAPLWHAQWPVYLEEESTAAAGQGYKDHVASAKLVAKPTRDGHAQGLCQSVGCKHKANLKTVGL